ncbi:hypothetical protein J1N35_014880 [Gossypium stocksii]|uniref:Uncharacterized protein n=1 Tax=Gossypium stocksii TaxID=47602 RepID=A0A9D3VX79_9ROSI|nr:hypothetical protein J1N35_014880 [Gossypium stocksii]
MVVNPFMMLYYFNAPRKLSLLENSLPISNSLESDEKLVRSCLLCGRSKNSNASSVDRSTLCMWIRGEYAVNHRSSSLFESPSSSTGSVGTGSGSKNITTSAPSGLGSRGGSISDSSSNPPSSATYEVPSPLDVVENTSSLLVDVS